MTDLTNPKTQVNVVTTNSTSITPLELNTPAIIKLPSQLANSIINLEFYLDGEPVTTGITGTLVVEGQYTSGRIQSIASLNLSSVNTYTVYGKYTHFIAEVTALSGADTVIINVDQDVNIVDVTAATDGGATALALVSNTITGTSGYNAGTRTLTASWEVSASPTITGGVLGSVPYQSAPNVTSFVAPNTTSQLQVLSMTGTGTVGALPVWLAALSTNTANALVRRDGSGNFSANQITAATQFNGKLNGSIAGGVANQVLIQTATDTTSFLSYTSAATALTMMSRDANINAALNNSIEGFQGVTGSGGLTTLTVSSPKYTVITGSQGNNVRLPDATTCAINQTFIIERQDSSTLVQTVQYNNGTTFVSLFPQQMTILTCSDNTTTNGVWFPRYYIGYNGVGNGYQIPRVNATSVIQVPVFGGGGWTTAFLSSTYQTASFTGWNNNSTPLSNGAVDVVTGGTTTFRNGTSVNGTLGPFLGLNRVFPNVVCTFEVTTDGTGAATFTLTATNCALNTRSRTVGASLTGKIITLYAQVTTTSTTNPYISLVVSGVAGTVTIDAATTTFNISE